MRNGSLDLIFLGDDGNDLLTLVREHLVIDRFVFEHIDILVLVDDLGEQASGAHLHLRDNVLLLLLCDAAAVIRAPFLHKVQQAA